MRDATLSMLNGHVAILRYLWQTFCFACSLMQIEIILLLRRCIPVCDPKLSIHFRSCILYPLEAAAAKSHYMLQTQFFGAKSSKSIVS